MSKHDYTKYSKKTEPRSETVDIVETTNGVESYDVVEATNGMPEFNLEMVEETVETVKLPKIVEGVVSDCSRLNVRVAPFAEAEVACILNVNDVVEVNVDESVADWFKVTTAVGIDGYCMKRFISAKV